MLIVCLVNLIKKILLNLIGGLNLMDILNIIIKLLKKFFLLFETLDIFFNIIF